MFLILGNISKNRIFFLILESSSNEAKNMEIRHISGGKFLILGMLRFREMPIIRNFYLINVSNIRNIVTGNF